MSATVPTAIAIATATADVKTFRGESLEEVLPRIRHELGPDAVILRQRDRLKGGVGEEDVRAALDEDAPDFRDDFDAELEPAHAGVADELDADEARFSGPAAAAPAASRFAGMPFHPGVPFQADTAVAEGVQAPAIRPLFVQGPRDLGGAAIALAGAGGSAKTLTVARLATAYAARSDLDLVLVDTPAVSPGDEDGIRVLASDLCRLKGTELHVCMPATLSAAAGGCVLAALAPLRPSVIVLTHVDETPQVGAVVELATAGAPPLSVIGRDTGLDGGLALADPAGVAALVRL